MADANTPKRFFILIQGTVALKGKGKLGGSDYKQAASLRAGSCFGEYAMLENKWSFGAATASGDVVMWSLDREQFVRVLGDDLRPLIRRSLDKKKLVSGAAGHHGTPFRRKCLQLILRVSRSRP